MPHVIRHIAANPNASMTVTFPKHVPFLPFIRIPAATITFRGEAEVLGVGDIDAGRALVDQHRGGAGCAHLPRLGRGAAGLRWVWAPETGFGTRWRRGWLDDGSRWRVGGGFGLEASALGW